MENGADPNLANGLGRAPLHTAAMFCRKDREQKVIRYMVGKGANINIQDIWGKAPIHRAAEERRRVDCFQMFIDLGADLTLKTEEGKTALDLARRSDVKELLREAMGLN